MGCVVKGGWSGLGWLFHTPWCRHHLLDWTSPRELSTSLAHPAPLKPAPLDTWPSPAADARAGARGGGGAARHQNRALLPHPQLPAGHLWQRHAGKRNWLPAMCSAIDRRQCTAWLIVSCSWVPDRAPPVRLVIRSQLAGVRTPCRAVSRCAVLSHAATHLPGPRPPNHLLPQLKSMVRSRTDLFDFSAAALAAGGLTSLALFIAGLVASHGGAAPEVGGWEGARAAAVCCACLLGACGLLP